MIDYDKLKLAHELANKYSQQNHAFCGIHIVYYDNKPIFRFFCAKQNTGWSTDDPYENLDELINSLKELTEPEKPKPKYEVGQLLWFVDCPSSKYEPVFKIIQKECVSIDLDDDAIRYVFIDDFCWEIKEQDVFISKENLIEAQIDYWQSLRILEKECQHEYQKTLAKSGMYFISLCHKCMDQKPYTEPYIEQCQHESDGYTRAFHFPTINEGFHLKCKKCGEFYK